MQDNIEITPKQRKPRRTLSRTDKIKAAKLAIKHDLSCVQAEKLTGISKSVIAEVLQAVKANPEIIEFSRNKDKVYEGLQAKLVNLVDDDALKTMLNKRGLTDLGILEDKIRLIRGESTANVAYDARTINIHIAELKQMINNNNNITEIE